MLSGRRRRTGCIGSAAAAARRSAFVGSGGACYLPAAAARRVIVHVALIQIIKMIIIKLLQFNYVHLSLYLLSTYHWWRIRKDRRNQNKFSAHVSHSHKTAQCLRSYSLPCNWTWIVRLLQLSIHVSVTSPLLMLLCHRLSMLELSDYAYVHACRNEYCPKSYSVLCVSNLQLQSQ